MSKIFPVEISESGSNKTSCLIMHHQEMTSLLFAVLWEVLITLSNGK